MRRPRLLCAGGMHGHGHYALRSLLDGHSQIVAYPFFLASLFRHWRWTSLPRMGWDDALRFIWPLVTDDPIFIARVGITKEALGIDEAEFSRRFFSPEVAAAKFGAPLQLHDLVWHLIDSYRASSPRYRNADVSFYAFEVDCREYPWEDPYFRREVTHLFSYRDFNRSYTAHRAELLETHQWSLPHFLLAKGTLEISQLIRNWSLFKQYSSECDLVVFPFERMRVEPMRVMHEVCERLGIPYEPILEELTRNSVPETGYKTGGHSGSRIAKAGGTYLFPATRSEIEAAAFCNPIDPFTGQRIGLAPPGFSRFLAMAWEDSWTAIERPHLTSAGPYGPAQSSPNDAPTAHPNRTACVRALRRENLSGPALSRALDTACRLPRVAEFWLRAWTFLGLIAVYLTARFLGGRLEIWPHHRLLMRLGIHHKVDRWYRIRAFQGSREPDRPVTGKP